MAILRPGVGTAVFRDQGSEAGVADDIDPGSRGHLAVAQEHDILAAIGGETTQPIEESQRSRGQWGGRSGRSGTRAAWSQGGRQQFDAGLPL
jgi:hypothetical protein